MAIMVQYKNKSFAYVSNHALDDLIAANSIIAFRRASGWAEIGIGTLRGQGRSVGYEGAERRGAEEMKSCLSCSNFVGSTCRSSACPNRISYKLKDQVVSQRNHEVV